jgi:NTE family protein
MKPALVVSGGGSKGAFAVGAIRYLREEQHIEFGLVSGTSTGALIAPLAVTDELDLLEEIYTSVDTKHILKKVSLETTWDRGYLFDTTPLEKLVSKHLDDGRATQILDAGVPAFIATVCLQTGRLTYFQTGRFQGQPSAGAELVRVGDRATLITAIIASACQPVFMPPIWLPAGEQPVREYVDGGVREYAPIDVAITNGADDIYVVMHSPPPEDRTPKEGQVKGLTAIAGRALSLLIDEVGSSDLRIAQVFTEATAYLETIRRNARNLGLTHQQITQLFSGANPFVGRRPVRLHTIRPEKDFPTEGLDFNPAMMKDFVAWGRRRAADLLSGGQTTDGG